MAWRLDDGFFKIENISEYDQISTEAGSKILDHIQKFVALMVAAEDDDGLTIFQSCLGEILKRAADCRAKGLFMPINGVDDAEE